MQFKANGKIMLTSEYFALDGANTVALPTRYGQTMDVHQNDTAILQWDAYHDTDKPWMSTTFDVENFNSDKHDGDILQKLFRAARELNPKFLSDGGATVTTRLDFPNNWGLGSSSTLIHLIAQWANIDPFALKAAAGIVGSGYDIACAGAGTPILYYLQGDTPIYHPIDFYPPFADNLYFIHLNHKQNTQEGIAHYKHSVTDKPAIIQKLNDIGNRIIAATTLFEFETAITTHEDIISSALGLPPVKQKLFSDYWGGVKSLGAWGGDFVLATSKRRPEETFAYFHSRGYKTILKYNDIIHP